MIFSVCDVIRSLTVEKGPWDSGGGGKDVRAS